MGETLKYLLVGPEEITLETIEVHLFIKTLHNKINNFNYTIYMYLYHDTCILLCADQQPFIK